MLVELIVCLCYTSLHASMAAAHSLPAIVFYTWQHRVWKWDWGNRGYSKAKSHTDLQSIQTIRSYKNTLTEDFLSGDASA